MSPWSHHQTVEIVITTSPTGYQYGLKVSQQLGFTLYELARNTKAEGKL